MEGLQINSRFYENNFVLLLLKNAYAQIWVILSLVYAVRLVLL